MWKVRVRAESLVFMHAQMAPANAPVPSYRWPSLVLSGEVPPTYKGVSPLTIWSADKSKRALFTVECTYNELTHL